MKLNEKELLELFEKIKRIDNINKIVREFQGVNWTSDIRHNSWYSLTHTFSKNSISLLDDTLQKFLNKEFVEIEEYVLRIVIKYLVFKFDKSIVEEIFGFILLKIKKFNYFIFIVLLYLKLRVNALKSNLRIIFDS